MNGDTSYWYQNFDKSSNIFYLRFKTRFNNGNLISMINIDSKNFQYNENITSKLDFCLYKILKWNIKWIKPYQINTKKNLIYMHMYNLIDIDYLYK